MISLATRTRLSNSSAIREAYETAERLKAERGASEVFDFSIGNPTAPCPVGVKRALEEMLAASVLNGHGYMQDCGYADVRRAVADSLNRKFGESYAADNIVMTSGAACALNILMRTVLDAGDEVIAFAPCYPAYRVFAQSYGARFTLVPYEQKTLLPDLNAFEAALSTKTKMVIVNTPNNPTGLVYSSGLSHDIAAVIARYTYETGQDIVLVSDEPYRELAFDGTRVPWWPSLYENTAVVYSWSKSASIAGERIGYLALSPMMPEVDLVYRGACRSLGDLGFVNAPATAQRMALACVDDTVDISYYDRNRLALFESLASCGLSPVLGNGAFYLLVPAPDGDEERFVKRFEQRGVVVVGGATFGCPGYVRFSYCVEPQVIEGARQHFMEVAQTYSHAKGTC